MKSIYHKNVSKVGFLKSTNKGQQVMLKRLLVEETIKLNENVTNWKEGVQLGGELLENAGIIDGSYIQAMIQAIENLGPYVVIAPGIALPHARPEDGAKEIGLSLVTLSTPVCFGHEKNDPVSIIVCLSAIDQTSHLQVLSELSTYLNDRRFVSLVKKTKKKEEILTYLHNV